MKKRGFFGVIIWIVFITIVIVAIYLSLKSFPHSELISIINDSNQISQITSSTPICVDNDITSQYLDGKNIYVSGIVKYVNQSGIKYYNDDCYGSFVNATYDGVIEASCDGASPILENYYCPLGYRCSLGACINVLTARPNLVISGLSLNGSNVVVKIKNMGDIKFVNESAGAYGNIYVNCEIASIGLSKKVLVQEKGVINKGDELSAVCISNLIKGKYTIKATVDPDNFVSESNEYDNFMTRTFDV